MTNFSYFSIRLRHNLLEKNKSLEYRNFENTYPLNEIEKLLVFNT